MPSTSSRKLIDWAHQRGGLQPLRDRRWRSGAGAGVAGRRTRAVFWSAPPAEADVAVTEQIGQALAPLVTRGWELRARPTTALMLTRSQGAQRLSVEILAEPRPWLAGGSAWVAEDPAELGRRLRQWYAAVGTLPAASGAASAAVLSDHIMRGRARASRRRRVDTRGAARLGAARGADSARVVCVGGRGGAGVRAVRRTGVPGTTMPTAGLGRDADHWGTGNPKRSTPPLRPPPWSSRSVRSVCGA